MNRKLIINYGKKILRWYENMIAKNSLVGDKTFFDSKQFKWIEELEANWQKIRKELDEILKYGDNLPNFQDISPDQFDITQDNRWKTYFLYGYGIKVKENCQRCPETTQLIEKVPGMKTAMFSILWSHKHIPEHRGPYKGVLRYHLGLKIPQQKTACRIRVGNEIRYWEEGKSLVFDDSFSHEVWNDTDEIRVVLFMDVIRPIRFPFSIINQIFVQLIAKSPFVQNAFINNQKWNEVLKEKTGETPLKAN